MAKKDSPSMPSQEQYQPLIEEQARQNRLDVKTPWGQRTFGPEGMEYTQTGDTDALTQAMFQKQMNLMNPQFERRRGQIQQEMANRGLPMEGEAAGGEMGRFETARNQAMEQASLGAIGMGEEAMGRRAQLSQMLASGIQPIDVMGPAQMASGIEQQRRQQMQAGLGGLTQLGATALMGPFGGLAANQLSKQYA